MTDTATRVSKTNQDIKDRLAALSEAQKLDYQRRVGLAHSAYNEYANAEMYRVVYENAAENHLRVNWMKFFFFGSIVALLIDWFFFNFVGWSWGVAIVLLPVCFGVSVITGELADARAYRTSQWMHEAIKAGSLATQSGVGLYEIKKVYKVEKEFESPNIKEINSEEESFVYAVEKDDAVQLQWNKVYLGILSAIDKTRTN